MAQSQEAIDGLAILTGWADAQTFPVTPNIFRLAKTMIHVNSHKIRENQKHSTKQPVITVKKRCNPDIETHCKLKGSAASSSIHSVGSSKKGNLNLYGHEVEILGGCRVVYRPDSSRCGAKVWIETLHEVIVTCWD